MNLYQVKLDNGLEFDHYVETNVLVVASCNRDAMEKARIKAIEDESIRHLDDERWNVPIPRENNVTLLNELDGYKIIVERKSGED